MKVQLTRDCIVGRSEKRGELNARKAGEIVDVNEQDGKLLITSGCAIEPTKSTK